MALLVEVHASGVQQASSLLELLGRRVEGRSLLLGLLDRIMLAQRERFAGHGVRWRKLAASTVRRKRSEGLDPRPMIATGTLMRSLTIRHAPHQFVIVRPGQLKFGTRVWYARFHHQGKGLPRRTVVGVTRQHRASLLDRLRHLLMRGQ